MIISRTPFRITIAGGGTDIKSYYTKNEGFLISASINKYMYISVHRSPIDKSIRIKYSKSEVVSKINQIKHGIAKECLKEFKINNSIEISSIADLPGGTGLGSSSSYTVGLINCLSELKKKSFSKKDIADLACKIEINRLKKPIGIQDQYIASYGGIKKIQISKQGKIKINNLNINKQHLKDLEYNLLMFFTGEVRNNDFILQKQKDNMTRGKNNNTIKLYNKIKDIGFKIEEAISKGNIEEIGLLFDLHWNYKKKLSNNISSVRYDEIYNRAKENGAIGGKISGAGGGGFFLFVCTGSKNKLIKSMQKLGLTQMDFSFDNEGSKIISNFID